MKWKDFLNPAAVFMLFYFQYERHMEKEKAAEATKTIDAEWKELQMLISALKVWDWLTYN